jgi:membrane-associated protease RseP (regulator of RpoE activity)
MTGDRKPQTTPSSFRDFASYLQFCELRFKRVGEVYYRPDPDKAIPPRAFFCEAIQAPGVVDPGAIAGCLILSRGGVQAETGIASSLIFANGDVTARTVMNSVVMICDGDVRVARDHISRSLIVARGNITAPAASTSVLMAGGKVALANGNKPPKRVISRNIVHEGKANTLGVTFFELSAVGLEVKAANHAVSVAKVVAKSAAAQAGLRAGDLILKVGGKGPTDAESLRRLLRDALAVGDAAVKLRRGDQTLTAKMSLPA